MNYLNLIVIVFCLLNISDSLFAQHSNIYTKKDCSIDIIEIRLDTITGIANDECLSFKIDSTINGTWLVYSQSDSTMILYQVSIIDYKRNGIEMIYDKTTNSRIFRNYNDGKLNGPYFQLSSNNKIQFYCNYYQNMPFDHGYRYGEDGQVIEIIYYNNKGKIKKRISTTD